MDFATPPLDRQQAVLFPERLDQAIPPDHGARLLDELLGRIDWKPWTQERQSQRKSNRGRPMIHPRIIASVILYGILHRVHSSRDLEEAI